MSQPHDDDDVGRIALPLDEGAGPAHHITRSKADAMVQRALAEAGFGAAALAATHENTQPHGDATAANDSALENQSDLRGRRVFRTSYVAAAVLVVGATVGSASAAVLWYAKVRGTAPVTANATPRGERVASSRRAPAPGKVETPPADVAIPTEQPAASFAADETTPTPSSTEDWLVEGNRLRAAQRWRRADAAYARAVRTSPRSQSAYVARVASAAVRLEHLHDARGALGRYRAALRLQPAGPLSEEILFGIADAQRALGDRAAEQAALALFLREHPASPLAAQARARLE